MASPTSSFFTIKKPGILTQLWNIACKLFKYVYDIYSLFGWVQNFAFFVVHFSKIIFQFNFEKCIFFLKNPRNPLCSVINDRYIHTSFGVFYSRLFSKPHILEAFEQTLFLPKMVWHDATKTSMSLKASDRYLWNCFRMSNINFVTIMKVLKPLFPSRFWMLATTM